MRNIFDLFRKKQPEKKQEQRPSLSPNTYCINNTYYGIKESQIIKVQAQAGDVSVYGYSLEVRYKMNDGQYCPWFTYWNHRIYTSMHSALDAASKVFPSYRDGYEWRITPLYKMTEPEYRDWKIDRLFNDKPVYNPKVYPIITWRVKDDTEVKSDRTSQVWQFKKGTLFIQMENGSVIRISNQRDGLIYGQGWFKETLIKEDKVEEVNIKNEKWAHPHLCKELKRKIK